MMIRSTLIYSDWKIFFGAFEKALLPLRIHPQMTFLPELILFLGDLDRPLKIETTKYFATLQQDYVVLNVVLTKAEFDSFETCFQEKFPGCALWDTWNQRQGASLRRITLKIKYLTQNIIPLISTLPQEFIARHQNNMGSVIFNFTEILSRYAISPVYSDVLEETICRVVQRNVVLKFLLYRQLVITFSQRESLSLPVDLILKILDFFAASYLDVSNVISTNTSYMRVNPTDNSYLQFCLSLSIVQAGAIVNYFNELSPGSAYVNDKCETVAEKNNMLLTIINVKHAVLLGPKFAKQFEEVLYADIDNKRASYQKESEPAYLMLVPNTAERIAALEGVKEGMLTRSSIFSRRLAPDETAVKICVNAVKESPAEQKVESQAKKRRV